MYSLHIEGVTFLSTGNALYAELLENALISLGKFSISTAVVSDIKPRYPVDHFIKIDSAADTSPQKRDSRWYKTQMSQYVPFKTGWIIDSDVCFLKELPSVKSVLGKAPIGLVPDQTSFEDLEVMLPRYEEYSMFNWATAQEVEETIGIVRSSKLENKQHFNSGVIAYQDIDVLDSLCNQWHEEWLIRGGSDQLSFARASHKIGLSPLSMPVGLNFCLNNSNGINEQSLADVFVLHANGSKKRKEQFLLWCQKHSIL